MSHCNLPDWMQLHHPRQIVYQFAARKLGQARQLWTTATPATHRISPEGKRCGMVNGTEVEWQGMHIDQTPKSRAKTSVEHCKSAIQQLLYRPRPSACMCGLTPDQLQLRQLGIQGLGLVSPPHHHWIICVSGSGKTKQEQETEHMCPS